MRKALFAVLGVVALGGVAVASGVFMAGAGKRAAPGAVGVPAVGQAPAGQTPTPTAPSGSQGKASVQLHRRVVHVTIRNFAFAPARIAVSPGTRVVWTNLDSDPHTVAGDASGGGLSSAALDTGGRFAAVVKQAATIPYHCTIHPYMHGVLIVQN